MPQIPEQMTKVTVKLKANIYFEGGVGSHSITDEDGGKKTVGVIRPGQYHFTTHAPERMDIISGSCRIKLQGETALKTFSAGEGFNVPGESAFDITVESGLTEYLCTFLA